MGGKWWLIGTHYNNHMKTDQWHVGDWICFHKFYEATTRLIKICYNSLGMHLSNLICNIIWWDIASYLGNQYLAYYWYNYKRNLYISNS